MDCNQVYRGKIIHLPKNVILLGYGAIGKVFVEMVLNNFKVNLIVVDIFDVTDTRFTYIKHFLTAENHKDFLLSIIKQGDVLVDLTINVDFMDIWRVCMKAGVHYVNTSTEEWGDNENHHTAFPDTIEDIYYTSICYFHDLVMKQPEFNPNEGITSVFEAGMNPGLISHFTKKGLTDAAKYFLSQKNNPDFRDLDFKAIEKYLNELNYPKLAQATGLHTLHCSEIDNQWVTNPPTDILDKFYNTWSCRGFFTEALIPIQVSRGNHENLENEDFPRVRDNSLIMSWAPSYLYRAKSYVPFQDMEGLLIPHGETFSIRDFFTDKETGYAPTQCFVYDANQYAKAFVYNLPPNMSLLTCHPPCEVLEPVKYDLHGYDKVGALLLFKGNRGWWAGSIMDEHDADLLFDRKFGPTVIQVAAGCFASFLWVCNNRDRGNKWPDYLDTEFVLDCASPYLGRVHSKYVDITKTHLKDCYKFEDFITKTFDKNQIKK